MSTKTWLAALAACMCCGLAQSAWGQCASYTASAGPATFLAGTTDIGNHADDLATTITLPFSFTIYGTAFTTAAASSNGTLAFGSTSAPFTNVCLPTTAFTPVTAPVIFPHWNDMRTDATGNGIFTATVGVAPTRTFVIEWRAGFFDGTAGTANWSILLYEGQSTFDIVYNTIPAAGVGATSGVQASSTGSFTQFSCNTATLTDGLSVRYTCVPPAPGACCAGDGTCAVVVSTACPSSSVFGGNNSTCSGPNNTCPSTTVGACCGNTTGTCTFVANAAACATGNTFQGAGSTCGPTNPCTAQLGACCSSTGVCTQTLAAGCTGTTQTFTAAGMACTPTNSCTALLRACCSGTGTCSLTTMVGCTGTSQFQSTQTACTPTNPCTALLGACCSSTAGTCTQTTNTGCASPSVFQFIGATCSPSNPCGGACCNTTTGACTTVLNLAACNAGAGPFTANGVCTPNPCGGSCCNAATAACTTTVNAGACTGVFTNGGVCTPSPCPTPGDLCSAPILIASSTYNSGAIQVFTATDDTNVDPSCDSATNTLGARQGVWFQYTPTSNQGVLMSETGTQDVVLTVWTGADCSSLTQVICSDAEASIPVGLAANTTYWFLVSKFSNTAYAAATSITFTLAPSTTVIACCSQSTGACTFSNTTCATGTINNGAGVCTPTSCPASGTCCNNTTGACTVVFSAGLCPTGTTLTGAGTSCAAGQNPCPPTQACCTGTSCSITLASSSCPVGSVSQGSGSSCSATTCAAADECQTTQQVALVGANPSNSTGATTSTTLNPAGCPSGLTGSGGSNDIFFRFTAPATASYKLDTCGASGFDSVLSIHSGCPVGDSNLLACNDDFTTGSTCGDGSTPAGLRSVINTVTLTAGQLYYIRVAGYGATGGATGAFTLNITLGATGTCCTGSTCTLTDAGNCPTGSTFTPTATCSPTTCGPAGVCCRGSTCSTTVASAAACTASVTGMAGADFRAATMCNPAPVSAGPCCYANYDKINGIQVADIFAFLADWFAGSPFANTGGNGSPAPLSVQNIFDYLSDFFGGCTTP